MSQKSASVAHAYTCSSHSLFDFACVRTQGAHLHNWPAVAKFAVRLSQHKPAVHPARNRFAHMAPCNVHVSDVAECWGGVRN